MKEKYLSIGIDVGADFSLMAIALPSGEVDATAGDISGDEDILSYDGLDDPDAFV